jgi:transposase
VTRRSALTHCAPTEARDMSSRADNASGRQHIILWRVVVFDTTATHGHRRETRELFLTIFRRLRNSKTLFMGGGDYYGIMSTDAALLPDLTQLPDDVGVLKELVSQLYGTVQERERRIQQLEQHLHLLVKRFLRPGSEKIDPRQLALFAAELASELDAALASGNMPPADTPAQTDDKPPRKHTPHGRRRPPDTIEHKEVIHDLTPAQKLALGGEEHLVYIGEDVTKNYEWTPSSVAVVEHHQKKYVRRDAADMTDDASSGLDESAAGVPSADQPDGSQPGGTATGNAAAPAAAGASGESPSSIPELTPELAARFSSPVIVAPKPAMPIPGGVAGPGLLAQVIVSKYGDHLPLYRLERIFARQGVHFTRQTMCDWCAGCAKLLTPLSDLIRDEVLSSFVIHTDDTPVDVRDAHAKRQFQARFWTYFGDELHPLIWFDFTTTHQRAGPDRVLAEYTGYLQADGYGGYDDYEGVCLSDDTPILKVACWAHARRKFHDAVRTEPVAAHMALARIGQLYKLEKELRKRAAEDWIDLPIEARALLIADERRLHAQPVLDEFKKWLDKQVVEALPKSPIAVAVRYALNQWSALCRYVEDGRLAIDNNVAERALRGIAIGRKNWLFAGSEAGGRTAAVLFTMIGSAVRNNLDPWAYLRDVLSRMAALRDSVTGGSRDELSLLLPNRWRPALPDEPPAAGS